MFPTGKPSLVGLVVPRRKVAKQKYVPRRGDAAPLFLAGERPDRHFFLANRLYGIVSGPLSLPLGHPRGQGLTRCLDADESRTWHPLLYLRLLPRDGKSQGALKFWWANYVEQTYDVVSGNRWLPWCRLSATSPVRFRLTTPALLTLDEGPKPSSTKFRDTPLHFLFHDVRYRGADGGRGRFVELASRKQAENWAFDPEVLSSTPYHRSNEVIPQYRIDKIPQPHLFNQGLRDHVTDPPRRSPTWTSIR